MDDPVEELLLVEQLEVLVALEPGLAPLVLEGPVPPASRWNRSLGSLGRFLRLPLFVVDAEGNLAYFNEAAEPLLGGPYAEVGPLPAEEWSTLWAPTDAEGTPLPFERPPIIVALRERRPVHGWLRIVGLDGVRRPIEATAFPLEG